MRRYSPTSHNYPLITGPVHSYKPSKLPGEHTARLQFLAYSTIQHTSLHFLPDTHLLLRWESAREGEVLCLWAKDWRIIQLSQGSNPRYLAYKSRTLPVKSRRQLASTPYFYLLKRHRSQDCLLYNIAIFGSFSTLILHTVIRHHLTNGECTGV